MNLGLDGRRAIVGGASSGLGAAAARMFAAEGADLLLWSRDMVRLEAVASDLRSEFHVQAHVVVADASEQGAAEIVSNAAHQLWGGADILVLNAGGPRPVDPAGTTSDGWREAFQLLTITPIELATTLLTGMRARRYGRVIAILSSGVREPIEGLAYSNAGRAALAAWMKTVSRTAAADGVTINGVLPGRIATPRVESLDRARAESTDSDIEVIRQQSYASIPIGRYGQPDEFASAIAFLASDQASYITGSTVNCDGGMGRSLP